MKLSGQNIEIVEECQVMFKQGYRVC